jgi:hypothetical protein
VPRGDDLGADHLGELPVALRVVRVVDEDDFHVDIHLPHEFDEAVDGIGMLPCAPSVLTYSARFSAGAMSPLFLAGVHTSATWSLRPFIFFAPL